jgi:hypothetical protein
MLARSCGIRRSSGCERRASSAPTCSRTPPSRDLGGCRGGLLLAGVPAVRLGHRGGVQRLGRVLAQARVGRPDSPRDGADELTGGSSGVSTGAAGHRTRRRPWCSWLVRPRPGSACPWLPLAATARRGSHGWLPRASHDAPGRRPAPRWQRPPPPASSWRRCCGWLAPR